MPPTVEELEAMLRRFSHEEFRPAQKRVIDDLLAGRDVLAVLATGSGKSLTYEMASQFLPGLTVVVSPLIALMKDQIDTLQAIDIPVSLINSTLSVGEQDSEFTRVEEGESKLLYVTPERFEDEEFLERLGQCRVSLFAVDEAHSISEWGHDFRPAYLNLSAAIHALGRPTVLALTATATPWVRDEIIERLDMRNPHLIVAGTDRPNLFLEVLRVEREAEDRALLHRMFEGETKGYDEALCDELSGCMHGSGIIYTRTTKAAEETAEWLREWGISADFYHGQRKQAERDDVQERFMSGDLRVICATNAFGLGVDKSDVRFVIHRDVPASVEAYYQEAGRAGRDGEFARCTLIYRPADLSRAAFLAAGAHITVEKVRKIRSVLRKHESMLVGELAEETKFSDVVLGDLVAKLEHAGVLRERRGRIVLAQPDFKPKQVADELEQRREAYQNGRIEMMRRYAELGDCRRVYLLNYFGEEPDFESCERCDNDCLEGTEAWIPVQEDSTVSVPFEVGDRVAHGEWGEGVVQRVESDVLTVLFEDVGYKTLASELVVDNDLLKAMT